MLPLIVDLTGKKVVVFGGGEVGLRKARYFADEAEVAVVSREFTDGFQAERVRLVRSEAVEALEDWVDWADCVIAATDDSAVNERICAAARSRGKQYNCADGKGSFLIPSVIDRGNFIVAISTLGRSPAVSRRLKEELERMIPEEWASMVRLQEELREDAKRLLPDQPSREAFLRSVLEDGEVFEALKDDYDFAKRLALRKLEGGE
jgi:siroheme synthase-like protein